MITNVPFPRPPACTWALRIRSPFLTLRSFATLNAYSGVVAVVPLWTRTPYLRIRSLLWYSCRSKNLFMFSVNPWFFKPLVMILEIIKDILIKYNVVLYLYTFIILTIIQVWTFYIIYIYYIFNFINIFD